MGYLFSLQIISLEGWVDIMYYIQDAHSFWNWMYFVALIVVSNHILLPIYLASYHISILQVISLAGWVNIMYFVQDAHSFWDWIYFVSLIVVSKYYVAGMHARTCTPGTQVVCGQCVVMDIHPCPMHPYLITSRPVNILYLLPQQTSNIPDRSLLLQSNKVIFSGLLLYGIPMF